MSLNCSRDLNCYANPKCFKFQVIGFIAFLLFWFKMISIIKCSINASSYTSQCPLLSQCYNCTLNEDLCIGEKNTGRACEIPLLYQNTANSTTPCPNICYDEPLNSYCDNGCAGAWYLITLTLLFYFIEFLLSYRYIYRHVLEDEEVMQFDDILFKLIAAPPTIIFHYKIQMKDRKYYTVETTYKRGFEKWKKTSDHVKETSWDEAASKEFTYSYWQDLTLTVPPPENQLLRIHFDKDLSFADQHTRDNYESSLRRLYKGYAELQIPGYTPYRLAVKGVAEKPKFMTLRTFVILSLIGLSWPFRVWVNHKTVQFNLKFTKSIGL